jgi:hypothetical protein
MDDRIHSMPSIETQAELVSSPNSCATEMSKNVAAEFLRLRDRIRQLAKDHPDTPVSWPADGITHYRELQDWAGHVLRDGNGSREWDIEKWREEYAELMAQCEAHAMARNRMAHTLQTIALLGDTGSDIYKGTFEPDGPNGTPTGWRVAGKMREIAIESGELPSGRFEEESNGWR